MSQLLTETKQLLQTAPRQLTLTKISEGTGLQVSWLSAFSRDEINDPGVKKVETLNTFLKTEKAQREQNNKSK